MNFMQKLAQQGQISFPLAGGTFTVRRGPTLVMLGMLAVLLALGCWQVERLHWKDQLIQTITTRTKELPQNVRSLSPLYWHANGRPDTASRIAVDDLNYRPAAAIGQFLYGAEMFLTATSITGEGGYHVLTPMQLEDGRWLLVDRGWIPYSRRPDSSLAGPAKDHGAAGFARPTGVVQVAGLLRLPQHSWLQPTNKPAKDAWYGIDLTAMAQAAGIAGFLPFVLDADSDPNSGGFPVGGQTRLDLPNNHLVYSLIWFGLAAALLVIYGIHGWQPPARPEHAAKPAASALAEKVSLSPATEKPERRKPSWIAKLFEAPTPPPKPVPMLRLAPPVVMPPATVAAPIVTDIPTAAAAPPVELVKRVRRKRKPAEQAVAVAAPDMLTPAPATASAETISPEIASPDSVETAPVKPARKRRRKMAAEPVADMPLEPLSATAAILPAAAEPQPERSVIAAPDMPPELPIAPAAQDVIVATPAVAVATDEASATPARKRARRTRRKAADAAAELTEPAAPAADIPADTAMPPPAAKPDDGTV